MKALYNYLVLLLLIALNTSCLKAGLDDLETYNQNDITNVRFEYRWWDESGQRLRVMEMTTEKTIDNKAKEIVCTIKVPEATQTFTTAINVDASTSARISPVGNAPAMGIFPSDFSAKEFVYKVTAGNGDDANWTIRITDLNK